MLRELFGTFIHTVKGAETDALRAAVLVRESVTAGAVVGAEERTLAILHRLPAPKGRDRRAVDGDGLVGVLRLAARLVPQAPPTTTRLSCTVISPASRSTDAHFSPHTCPRQMPVVSSRRNGGEAVALEGNEKAFNVLGGPHVSPRAGDLGRLDVACRVVGDVRALCGAAALSARGLLARVTLHAEMVAGAW